MVATAVSALALTLGTVVPASAEESTAVTNLRTEGQVAPLGIDVVDPLLQWQLDSPRRGTEQVAYQIRVSSTAERAAEGTADMWDSGRVEERDVVHAHYGGAPLESREDYFWTVRVWDDSGAVSDWSEPTSFEMGLLEPEDWSAQWVARTVDAALPVENTQQDYPASLEEGSTLGQTFETDAAFTATAGRMPTWSTDDSGFTMSLRQDGPEGDLLAEHRVVDHPDNGWATLELEEPLPAGSYYLEISDLDGTAGWWSHTQDTYAHGTAYADGEPVAGDRTVRWQPAELRLDERTSLLRTDLELDGEIASARLYATALGVYELELNGERVGDHHFAPGWTEYDTRVQYQTYDVTDLLRPGANALAAGLSTGWYAGRVAIYGPNLYGDLPALLAQLEVTYTDGRTERFVTDGSWTTTQGPTIASDMLDGEVYDAREIEVGHSERGFDDAAWAPVTIVDGTSAELVAQADPPVRELLELPAQEVTAPDEDTYLVDLGQNMVGNVRLTVRGAAPGDEITLRYGEVLTPEGELYTENLRSARATDTYVAAGEPVETWQPRFTFHGFRYVEVSGYPGDLADDAVVGVVLGTDVPRTGTFASSSPMLNQLQSNIEWSQRGNFLSVPTDTPARDERMGWTGDINVFAPTAAFNSDISRFLGDKWLRDLRDAQRPDGAVTDVVPFVPVVGAGNAGWGDAAITVPYTIWQAYGDTSVITENYDAMTDWIAYLEETSDGLLRPASGYGDHLNLDDPTPVDLVSTAYFAHVADLLSTMATAVGETEDAAELADLSDRVGQAFRGAYLAEDGRLTGDTQTSYVLALAFDLVPDDQREQVTDHLLRRLEDRDWHLATGFLGTPNLLDALSENGHLDIAYRLLSQRSYPSWGYEIDKGATTTWEHWNSIKPDGSFMDPSMNSFNHYAYGAVGSWMYRNIAGIAPDAQAPGYRNTIVRPVPGGEITSAAGSYESRFGQVATDWQLTDAGLAIDVTVPAGAGATVYIPEPETGTLLESGVSAAEAEGVELLGTRDGVAVYQVGSGEYSFRPGVEPAPSPTGPDDEPTTAQPTTAPTATPTTPPTPPPSDPGEPAPGATGPGGELPQTGAGSRAPLLAAFVLLLLGSTAVVTTARRRAITR